MSGRDPAVTALAAARLYDRRLIQQRLRHLRVVRERGDAGEMAFALRSDLLRNLGNIAASELHVVTLYQVPQLIREYIDEVRTHLQIISRSPALPLDERLAFLRETRHAFGRTALVLSGGGSFGSFHLGVVKALLDGGLLPRVLSGSSAGAIVAALICTRTEDELAELFASLPERLQGIDFYASNSAAQIIKHLVLKGTLQDHAVLQERLHRLLGDVTFQEAYARSGRILNVSVSAADTTEPPRLLNYLTAPNVIVWSAVACSSAFPFLFAPQTLMARDAQGRVVPFANQVAGESQRRWRDGSLEEDLPMRGLSEMFNVNYFLVSQCNPYLLPIIAAKQAVPRTLGALAEQEFKHRCKQLMEILPRSLGASRVLKLLSQPWEGDITMVLPASRLSTLKAVVNLSREDLLLALGEGQRATWAKLSAIAANCDVEVTLDECLRKTTAASKRVRRRLQRRASAAALAGPYATGDLRRGIPSWLHLQALGLAPSDSLETLEDTSVLGAAQHEGGATPEGPRTIRPPQAGWTLNQHPGMMGLPRVRSSRSAAAMHVDLTDTVVPEEVEVPMSIQRKLVEGVTDRRESTNSWGELHPALRGDIRAIEALTEAALEAEIEAEAEGDEDGHEEIGMASRRVSMGCSDDVWRELFNVVPATTSDALDFIAP